MLHVLTAVPAQWYLEEPLENKRFKLVLKEENASIPLMLREMKGMSYFYIAGGQTEHIYYGNKPLNSRNLDNLLFYTWTLGLLQKHKVNLIINEI